MKTTFYVLGGQIHTHEVPLHGPKTTSQRGAVKLQCSSYMIGLPKSWNISHLQIISKNEIDSNTMVCGIVPLLYRDTRARLYISEDQIILTVNKSSNCAFVLN
mgnify:CR=1 FL=1